MVLNALLEQVELALRWRVASLCSFSFKKADLGVAEAEKEKDDEAGRQLLARLYPDGVLPKMCLNPDTDSGK